MEELWKLREIGYRLTDLAKRAEYDRMVKRFHEEEQRANLKNLLYDPDQNQSGNEENPG